MSEDFSMDDALAMIVGSDARHIVRRAEREKDRLNAKIAYYMANATDDCLRGMIRMTMADEPTAANRSLLAQMQAEARRRGLNVLPFPRAVK